MLSHTFVFLNLLMPFTSLAISTSKYHFLNSEQHTKVCHDEEYDRILGQYSVPDDMLITVNPAPVGFCFGLGMALSQTRN